MSIMFHQVMQMSITASYVIIAVLLLRLLLRKTPKKYSYMLWAAVLFRLCCPFSFSSVLSIFNLVWSKNEKVIIDLSEVPVSSAEPITETVQTISTGIPQITEAIQEAIAATAPSGTLQPSATFTPSQTTPSSPVQQAAPSVDLMDILCIIWAAGMLFLLVRAAVSYIRLKKQLKASVPYSDGICQANIESPFLMGLIRPMIYIPFDLEPECEKISIAHERYHLKRKDNWIRMISYLLLCVHWINPLCWLAYFFMEKDMEMSCDEHVLSDGKWSRKDYSEALLSVSSGFRFPSANPVAFGESNVKERILNSMRFKHPNRLLTVVATFLCIVTLVACASNGKPSPSVTNTEVSGKPVQTLPESSSVNETKDPGPYLEPVDYTVQPEGSAMTNVVTSCDFRGAPMSSGVYFFSSGRGLGLADYIMYLDYSTGKTDYLCSDPECHHSSYSCTSRVENSSDCILLTTANEDCLLLFDVHHGILKRMEPDGSNREEILRIADHKLNYYEENGIQSYGDKIYMIMYVVDSADDAHPRGYQDLIEIDVNNAAYRVVMSVGSSCRICGGYGTKLLLEEQKESYTEYETTFSPYSRAAFYSFDVTTGKVEKITEAEIGYLSFLNENKLMQLNYVDGELVCELYDLKTGGHSIKALSPLPEFIDQEPNYSREDYLSRGNAIDSTHFSFCYSEFKTNDDGDVIYDSAMRPELVRYHWCIVDTENGTAVPFDTSVNAMTGSNDQNRIFARNGDTLYIYDPDGPYPQMYAVTVEECLNGIRTPIV